MQEGKGGDGGDEGSRKGKGGEEREACVVLRNGCLARSTGGAVY